MVHSFQVGPKLPVQFHAFINSGHVDSLAIAIKMKMLAGMGNGKTWPVG